MERSGWALSCGFAIFMLGASVAPKFLGLAIASDTLKVLGWQPSAVVPIGFVELICVLLYLWPRTSVLGAVLATALLGGAVATQLRVGAPLFSHSMFGVYLGLMMWGGLWLRDVDVRAMMPVRKSAASSDATRLEPSNVIPGISKHD